MTVGRLPEGNKPELHKIVSYNILAPLHGEGSKHGYTPLKERKWRKRKRILFDEIRYYDPDIICLQESTQRSRHEFGEALKDKYIEVGYVSRRMVRLFPALALFVTSE